MKQTLITAYHTLREKIRAISNKNWIQGHGYYQELQLNRIRRILMNRYLHDPDEKATQ